MYDCLHNVKIKTKAIAAAAAAVLMSVIIIAGGRVQRSIWQKEPWHDGRAFLSIPRRRQMFR